MNEQEIIQSINSKIYSSLIPTIKKIINISDFSLWRKRWKKRIGKIIYHKKYTTADIIKIMKLLGMKEGSVVCVHSSMMEFYNYLGTAQELIEAIIDVIGEEGTLMMPAFPVELSIIDGCEVFDVNNDKTGAGFLAETFRRFPGVLRSANVRHSVCAFGKYAEYLVKDHTKGHDCWDEHSPWYRLCQLEGLVFNLGMPRSYMGTFHHCVESQLQDDYPYWRLFFSKKQTFKYYNNGEIHTYQEFVSELLRKTRKKKVTRYFTSKEWKIAKISNLEIKVFYSKNALQKMVELGKRGISLYSIPSTKDYDFESK